MVDLTVDGPIADGLIAGGHIDITNDTLIDAIAAHVDIIIGAIIVIAIIAPILTTATALTTATVIVIPDLIIAPIIIVAFTRALIGVTLATMATHTTAPPTIAERDTIDAITIGIMVAFAGGGIGDKILRQNTSYIKLSKVLQY